jgi:4-alpha-glucanotransferase
VTLDELERRAAFIRAALKRLGVRRLVLGVHASAFPPDDRDVGYGAPLSAAGQRLLTFAAGLGFNALQLGPSGQVSPLNVSPYDGSVFARNVWSLGLTELTRERYGSLLDEPALERLALPPLASSARVQPQAAAQISRRVLDACHAGLQALRAREPRHGLLQEFAAFRSAQAEWLELDGLYEALAERAGDDPAHFEPALAALFEPGAIGQQRRAALRITLAPAIERAEFAQFLCALQHAEFRARAHAAGLALWGDMQVGFSHRDRFLHRDSFATRWLLGAPPSRTNPHGQPWGYPLLDPDQLEDPNSPARRLFGLRLRKLLAEYDGVRIDHPHGLVCPWVYSASDPDPHHAVRHGARAFESPALDPDAASARRRNEPTLASWAIAQAANLNPHARSHFADDWVSALSPAQVARYARLFDPLIELCEQSGRDATAIAAEVLSTCPFPLQCVLTRHGLGRFRVTQKANPSDPRDPYRTEHAQPDDWLMLGTHDTPPVFAVLNDWLATGKAQPRAAYLAERLIAEPAARATATTAFSRGAADLARAMLADLFGSPARNIYVFVGDLFGELEPFNRAGVVHPDNWAARLPADFETVYESRLREGRALDIAGALQLALARAGSIRSTP